MTRPTKTLQQAVEGKLTKPADDDPEQLTRVTALAKSNPGAYADLPADLRARAAMHATAAPAAPAGGEGAQQ